MWGTCCLNLGPTLLTINMDMLCWRYETQEAINIGWDRNVETSIQHAKNERLDIFIYHTCIFLLYSTVRRGHRETPRAGELPKGW